MSLWSMGAAKKNVVNVALWVLVPYLGGCLLSQYVLPEGTIESFFGSALVSGDASAENTKRNLDEANGMTAESITTCQQRLQTLLGFSDDLNDENPLERVSFLVHRNGQPEACGKADSEKGFYHDLLIEYSSFRGHDGQICPISMDKYQVESLLTRTFHRSVHNSCQSEESDAQKGSGFFGFCDMGPKRTPILLDHDDLVPIPRSESTTSLPCRFHNREGLRVTELNQLVALATNPSTTISKEDCETNGNGEQLCRISTSNERHLYAVPAGRVFMFAPSYVGELFHLPHVEGSDQKKIYLEVLSLTPRVFDVFNFFSREESDDLVQKAIAEKKDSHKIKRSSTGASGYNLNSRRTSESGFDTHGKTAVKVKKRCFKALGFDEYWESHGDGLQILRYNVSKAYNSHLDWIEDKSGQLEHDFETAGTGGNRFATILMYMSDLGPEDGGETVFPQGWPPHIDPSERVSTKDALESLRGSENGNVLERGSWEENLVAKCRTRLSVRPHSSRAVLFYSTFPNGEVDPSSLHGACPVLSKQKYAANLWAWNTPRQGYPGAPVKEKFRDKIDHTPSSSPETLQMIEGKFKNSGKDPKFKNAELFFQDQFWGTFGPGDVLAVNTYATHEWNVKVDGTTLKTWVVQNEDGKQQEFVV